MIDLEWAHNSVKVISHHGLKHQRIIEGEIKESRRVRYLEDCPHHGLEQKQIITVLKRYLEDGPHHGLGHQRIMEGDGQQQKEISTQTCLKIEQNLPNFAQMEMFKYRGKGNTKCLWQVFLHF